MILRDLVREMGFQCIVRTDGQRRRWPRSRSFSRAQFCWISSFRIIPGSAFSTN